MSVNFLRGTKSFFLSYANDDDADALFGNFGYQTDGNQNPDIGNITISRVALILINITTYVFLNIENS